MRVVAFNGSPRREGNTAILLRAVLAEVAARGGETELVQVGGRRIAGCRACLKCWKNLDGRCAVKNDPINGWIAKAVAADGIVLGSPTYFSDVSAEMKAFIDRVGYVSKANGYLLRGRVGAAVASVARTGAVHALDTMHHLFLNAQMYVVGAGYMNSVTGRNPGDVEEDAVGMQNMRDLGRNLAQVLLALAAWRQGGGDRP